jgi:TgpA N-terminal domain/Transglutaminase-like superfamily
MRSSSRMTLAAGMATALGAIPLGSVFTNWRWVWFSWAAIAAVAGAGLLARSVRLPAVLVPLAGALGLLVYLTVIFASEEALFGLVPTPASIDELIAGIDSGLADVRDLAAPVPATPGLVLLTAASIGGLALVVDMIAVGLRRPAAAGLPLLALYAVPASIAVNGVPWPLFVVGASGYLGLLLIEGRDRLLRWGRPVGAVRPGTVSLTEDDAPLPLTGQRIGATALALAVLLPVFIPGITTNALSEFGRTGLGGDSGEPGRGVALNPFTSLRGELLQPEPREVFQVQTNLQQPFYLRTIVLEQFTSNGWQRRRPGGDQTASGSLERPEGSLPESMPSDYYTATFSIKAYRGTSLPTFYQPWEIQGLGDEWQYNRDTAVVFSTSNRADEFDYEVEGRVPDPTRADLEGATEAQPGEEYFQRWGRVPATLPVEVRRTVEDVVADAPTPYARALALNNFFTDGTAGFSYSTQTESGNSGDALVDFLDRKQGYCEQYASAMGIMLRVAGIPARVVMGYTPGARTPEGYWSVRTSDAHAWVEAYFEGVGWVPFDPTPLADGRTVNLPYAPRPFASPTPSGSIPTGATSGGPTLPDRVEDPDLAADIGSGNGTDSRAVAVRAAVISAVTLALLVLLIGPALGRRITRRRRMRAAAGRDPTLAAHGAWDEVQAAGIDYGVPPRSTETPRTTARRLTRELRLGAAATAGLRLLALAEERARYAPQAGVDGDLPTAVRAVRRGLRDHASRRQRWRAALLPPSTIRAVRAALAARLAAASLAMGRLAGAIERSLSPRRLLPGRSRAGR